MRNFTKVSRRLAILTRSAIPSPRTGRFVLGGGPALGRGAPVLTALLLLTPSLFAQEPPPSPTPPPQTIVDQFAINRVGSPQNSPDGAWVA